MVKTARKAICLIFVCLFSVNIFAAIVGDNDGPAFITKSEFENLKKDFASQIDRYNDSLDNKIDGKVASYLAGIRIAKKEYKRSSLEVAGQTYQGVKRKSYVFCGNDSVFFMRRYNNESGKFVKNYNPSFDSLPNLQFILKYEFWDYCRRNSPTSNGEEMYGADSAKISFQAEYKQKDDSGNYIPSNNSTIFVVDEKNYVVTFKIDAALCGIIYRIAQSQYTDGNTMAAPFYADNSYRWTITTKDVVGAGGTNGMGYSTRSLGDGTAATMIGWRYRLYANESTSRSGYTYLGKTITDRSGNYTRYILKAGSGTAPEQFNQGNIGTNAIEASWFDRHLHFEESRFGESYAWCMPFGHLLPNRKAACFAQWPAWNMVNWATYNTVNMKSLNDSSDHEFSDTTGQHTWSFSGNANTWQHNGVSRTYYDSDYRDISNYVDIEGMLPIWKENPLKDWRLLKNKNIKNALGVDAYYAAAPPLTEEFSEPGSFTWVAKINQEDKERIPGWNFNNWGTNRIYFTKGPMDDIEYEGTNVKVSNTKKFQYKKHGVATADWTDCQSQVINDKTYYYLTMEHNTYYDFKMDVEAKETVYYMIFDEKKPNDYCLEVIEHPDHQIEFTSD